MIAKTHVYLRADGNSQIGLGHLHRLIALGEMLQNDFDCAFITRSPLPGIRDLIMKSSISIIEIDENLSLEHEPETLLNRFTGNEIIVLDGYLFDTEYQRRLKKKNSQLICIDDIHQYHFVSDIVINPAGGVDPAAYSMDPATTLLTGPAYAFLKKPFIDRTKNLLDQSPTSLLICMGGADPNNNTLSLLTQCVKFPFEGLKVIIGEAYRHKNLLDKFIRGSGKKIEVLVNLSPAGLADVMARCGVAITSASGIAYEYASIGGELYVMQTADNQKELFSYLTRSQLAFPVDHFRAGPQNVKISRSQQKKIFDGASAERFLKLFKGTELKLHLRVRTADKGDLLTLFRWANDLEQRRQSFTTDPISLEDHTRWFTKKIADPTSLMYIFEFRSIPMALVRFDAKNDVVISYSIDKEYRGKGFGQIVLSEALKKFRQESKLPVKVVGFVKNKNTGSIRIFEKLGFTKKDTTDYPESRRYEYTMS